MGVGGLGGVTWFVGQEVWFGALFVNVGSFVVSGEVCIWDGEFSLCRLCVVFGLCWCWGDDVSGAGFLLGVCVCVVELCLSFVLGCCGVYCVVMRVCVIQFVVVVVFVGGDGGIADSGSRGEGCVDQCVHGVWFCCLCCV